MDRRDRPRNAHDGAASVHLRLTLTDTLGVWADGSHAFNPLAKVTRTYWYRLPADWFAGGALIQQRREQLIDELYGPGWRSGNADGSRYLILDLQERVLTPEQARARPWLGDRAGFYVWTGDVLHRVGPAEL